MASRKDTPRSPALHRLSGPLLALLLVLLCMVLPMLLIKRLADDPSPNAIEASVGATVALGALFRSSGRTVLRSGLRSTVMSAVRTMTRAITRRIVRSFLPMMMRLFLPALRSSTSNTSSAEDSAAEVVEQVEEKAGSFLSSLLGPQRQSLWFSLPAGMLTLGLSFYGVVHLSGNDDLLGGLSGLEMSLMATVPLVVHFALFTLLGRLFGVQIELRTDLDGILLQGYFTGALSYLPLASDIEMEGSLQRKGACAAGVLFGMLCVYTFLALLGDWTGDALLSGCAAQVLLYAFVLSFPLPPLDGSDVWALSRWAWLALWTATLLTFLGRMPEAFYEIL